ncbi:hypothetical protein HA402_003174 [Bradysia odoriphaga]|nr:hypothetical protein HA402_003174 [Bradysia odoriphaga]
MSLKVGYLQPKARGQVQLRSRNPADPVRLQANYLGHPDDLAGSIRAVKFGLSFLETASLKPLIKDLLMPQPAWGSCRMGQNTEDSVTDLQLRVHGFERLRVVDCSVMPQVTSGNTNAPTIMLAEKAVDLILGETL